MQRWRLVFAQLAVLLAAAGTGLGQPASQDALRPRVEVEEDVYRYEPANNGAGPMWCFGNTCVVRAGQRVWVSGLETIAGTAPLNNCLPLLWERTEAGWKQVYRGTERTREPCPLAVGPDGRVILSVNPTLTPPDTYGGPAQPQVLEFLPGQPAEAPRVGTPVWQGNPQFTEHSYRSFAADGDSGSWILFQNIGYDHAEWAFRDEAGHWSAQGKLVWPWGAEYDKPQHIRLCYATVALKGKSIHFCAVSDIIEPYTKWREYKKKLTGRDWDYDFRRLFYTWCDDVTTGQFHDWVEISSRDKTCGWIFPNDLYLSPTGDCFVLWNERAIDERLREAFYPDAKQRQSLELAVLHDGAISRRHVLAEAGEGLGEFVPGRGRFHVTPQGRLLAIYHVAGRNAEMQPISENRLAEIHPDGSPATHAVVPLARPLDAFFTSTVRAGCRPAATIDLLGDLGGTLRYARVELTGSVD